MPDEPARVELCARRYRWNGHDAWCLKPEGHEGACGEGVVSGRPHVKSTHMPRKRWKR